MANYWTKKDDESEELHAVKPWEEKVSHGDIVLPKNVKQSLLELSEARYSVRNYKADAVPESDLQYVLECARLAPSAVNRQPWHFYICRSEESLQKVRQCYGREWFATAPLVIIGCVCHDEEWIRSNDGHPHGIVDISIATEHICLAATERGLGTCWVCNFNVQQCHELFCLPESQEPAVLIPLGYPVETEIPRKKRKEIGEIVSYID